MSRPSGRLIGAAAWIAAPTALATWALVRGVGPADAARTLVEAVHGAPWAPLAFIAVYLLRPLFFFSAAVLTVAGGFLFGPGLGIALVVVAANGSAMVAYALARWLGAGRVAEPSDRRRLARWAGRMRDRGFESVISMRLLHLPYDLVSYLAGALRIHPGAFLVGTAIGSAPTTVALVLFGASLESFDGGVPGIDGPALVASLVMLAAGLALAHLVRTRERRSG